MWGINLLLLLLGAGQVQIATTKSKNFFIFEDSISRIEDKVIFAGKVKEGNREYVTTFLASCSKRTYVIYASQVKTAKGYEWYQNHSKQILAKKGSAMDAALDLLCGPVEWYQKKKPIRELDILQ